MADVISAGNQPVKEKKRGRGRPPKTLAEKKKGGVVGSTQYSQDDIAFCKHIVIGGSPADFFVQRGVEADNAPVEAAVLLGRLDILDLIDRLLATTGDGTSIKKSALITYHWRRMLDPRTPQASKDASAKEVKDLMGFSNDKNQGVRILLNVQLGNGKSIVTSVNGQKGQITDVPVNDDETGALEHEQGTEAGSPEPAE